MWNAIFLALACLLGMSAVLAFMPSTGDLVLSEAAVALPSTMSTLAINEAEDAPVVNTASKADKLSIAALRCCPPESRGGDDQGRADCRNERANQIRA
jgi:hypothetical protein